MPQVLRIVFMMQALFICFSADAKAARLEWKTAKRENAHIVGVYNPSTREVEWKDTSILAGRVRHGDADWSTYKKEIAGVYNPDTHSVEWRTAKRENAHIVGVYNPSTRQVEWKDTSRLAGRTRDCEEDWSTYKKEIAGVYNPDTHSVEWRTAKRENAHIVGVYNPSTRQVHWKDTSILAGRIRQWYPDWSTYKKEIAGVYNPDTHSVEWRTAKRENAHIVGVYNPSTRQVEWKDTSNLAGGSTYKKKIAAVYIPETEEEISAYSYELESLGQYELQKMDLFEETRNSSKYAMISSALNWAQQEKGRNPLDLPYRQLEWYLSR